MDRRAAVDALIVRRIIGTLKRVVVPPRWVFRTAMALLALNGFGHDVFDYAQHLVVLAGPSAFVVQLLNDIGWFTAHVLIRVVPLFFVDLIALQILIAIPLARPAESDSDGTRALVIQGLVMYGLPALLLAAFADAPVWLAAVDVVLLTVIGFVSGYGSVAVGAVRLIGEDDSLWRSVAIAAGLMFGLPLLMESIVGFMFGEALHRYPIPAATTEMETLGGALLATYLWYIVQWVKRAIANYVAEPASEDTAS